MIQISMKTALTAVALTISMSIAGCSDGNSEPVPGPSRVFLMGSTPFFASADDNFNVIFPDWRFENLDDRDLVSLHVDDFWGVPWDYCDAAACTNLPDAWVAQWLQLASDASATGKPLYLALSPLGGRRTLAPTVLSNGATQGDWNTNVDGNGCYRFATDPNSASYKAAYISYLKYIIDLVGPEYFSPAVEVNLPFTICPAQKAAWIAWYSDVHNAIKAAYPQLVVFPTFQQESMYGVNDAQSACPGVSVSQCFDQRLTEALAIPGDRIAFSTYPAGWTYSSDYNHSFPRDTYAKVQQATSRKIWISETGWAASPVLQSYAHSSGGSCGAELYPATLDVPGTGTVNLANDTAHAEYLGWLLDEAQTRGFEAVVWWLNRDYLDGPVATTCPCTPPDSDTCVMTDTFYTLAGNDTELLLRVFGNMALRYYDGSPRPGESTWHEYVKRSYQP